MKILYCLLSTPTAIVVVGQLTIVLFQAVTVKRFHGPCRAFVQRLASFLKHRAIGDFLRERMFENIFHLGESRLFVEKFFSLE